MATDLEQPASRTARTGLQLAIVEPVFQFIDAWTNWTPEQNRGTYGVLVLVAVFVMNLIEKKTNKHIFEKAVPTKNSDALEPEVKP